MSRKPEWPHHSKSLLLGVIPSPEWEPPTNQVSPVSQTITEKTKNILAEPDIQETPNEKPSVQSKLNIPSNKETIDSSKMYINAVGSQEGFFRLKPDGTSECLWVFDTIKRSRSNTALNGTYWYEVTKNQKVAFVNIIKDQQLSFSNFVSESDISRRFAKSRNWTRPIYALWKNSVARSLYRHIPELISEQHALFAKLRIEEWKGDQVQIWRFNEEHVFFPISSRLFPKPPNFNINGVAVIHVNKREAIFLKLNRDSVEEFSYNKGLSDIYQAHLPNWFINANLAVVKNRFRWTQVIRLSEDESIEEVLNSTKKLRPRQEANTFTDEIKNFKI